MLSKDMEIKDLYSWSKNGMKMIINSDFKTFNKQTNCIGAGNVIANTQYSSYIRPFCRTISNTAEFKEGYLRDYDLQYFGDGCNSWNDVKKYVKSITEKDSCILYEFFYYQKELRDDYGYVLRADRTRQVIGYIIEQKGKYKIIQTDFQNRDKKFSALDLCRKIIESER